MIENELTITFITTTKEALKMNYATLGWTDSLLALMRMALRVTCFLALTHIFLWCGQSPI